jgi:hypothetical protein
MVLRERGTSTLILRSPLKRTRLWSAPVRESVTRSGPLETTYRLRLTQVTMTRTCKGESVRFCSQYDSHFREAK